MSDRHTAEPTLSDLIKILHAGDTLKRLLDKHTGHQLSERDVIQSFSVARLNRTKEMLNAN